VQPALLSLRFSPCWRALGIALGLSLAACGARASPGPDEDPTGSEGQGAASAPGNDHRPDDGVASDRAPGGGGRASAPGRAPGDPIAFGTMVLPDCVLGFMRRSAEGRTCAYRNAGLCYEDLVGACACACPRGKGPTQCVVEDFLSERGETQDITCFAQ
jgi:hypothetical protein